MADDDVLAPVLKPNKSPGMPLYPDKHIQAILREAEAHGGVATAKRHKLPPAYIYRWKAKYAEAEASAGVVAVPEDRRNGNGDDGFHKGVVTHIPAIRTPDSHPGQRHDDNETKQLKDIIAQQTIEIHRLREELKRRR